MTVTAKPGALSTARTARGCRESESATFFVYLQTDDVQFWPVAEIKQRQLRLPPHSGAGRRMHRSVSILRRGSCTDRLTTRQRIKQKNGAVVSRAEGSPNTKESVNLLTLPSARRLNRIPAVSAAPPSAATGGQEPKP